MYKGELPLEKRSDNQYQDYQLFPFLLGDRTAIYISHRLFTCQLCDKIAVFHEVRLIQQGSHEQLVQEQEEKYYEVWSSQAQYYV